MAINLAGQTIQNDGGLGASSTSFSHTTPTGNDRLLLVIVQAWKVQTGSVPFTVSGLTYGGSSLTYITRIQAYTTNRNYTVEAWYMKAPAVGSATVAVTWSKSVHDAVVACLALDGVDQTTPIPQSDAAAPKTTEISFTLATGAADAWLVGGSMVYGGAESFTPGSGVTEEWDEQTGTDSSTDFTGGGGYRACGAAGSYTWGQTATASRGHCGVVVEVAANPVLPIDMPSSSADGRTAIDVVIEPTRGLDGTAWGESAIDVVIEPTRGLNGISAGGASTAIESAANRDLSAIARGEHDNRAMLEPSRGLNGASVGLIRSVGRLAGGQRLAASADAGSWVAADLGVVVRLAGEIRSRAEADSALNAIMPLVGAGHGVADANGGLTANRDLISAADGVTRVSAAGGADRDIAGAADGRAQADVALAAGGMIVQAYSEATTAAELWRSVGVAATELIVHGEAATGGRLNAEHALIGRSDGGASTFGRGNAGLGVAVDAGGETVASADANATFRLAATAHGGSAIDALLLIQGDMTSRSDGDSEATASFIATLAAAGEADGATSVSAKLDVVVDMAGRSRGRSAADALIGIDMELTIDAIAQASVDAPLGRDASLAAEVDGDSWGYIPAPISINDIVGRTDGASNVAGEFVLAYGVSGATDGGSNSALLLNMQAGVQSRNQGMADADAGMAVGNALAGSGQAQGRAQAALSVKSGMIGLSAGQAADAVSVSVLTDLLALASAGSEAMATITRAVTLPDSCSDGDSQADIVVFRWAGLESLAGGESVAAVLAINAIWALVIVAAGRGGSSVEMDAVVDTTYYTSGTIYGP